MFMDKTKDIVCCDEPLEFRLENGQPWQSYTPERATCNTCKIYYERKQGNDFAYKREESHFVCSIDNSKIVEVEVKHHVDDGSFVISGLIRHHIEVVPYCLVHEKIPDDLYGSAIVLDAQEI